jgi:hypothetical protein
MFPASLSAHTLGITAICISTRSELLTAWAKSDFPAGAHPWRIVASVHTSLGGRSVALRVRRRERPLSGGPGGPCEFPGGGAGTLKLQVNLKRGSGGPHTGLSDRDLEIEASKSGAIGPGDSERRYLRLIEVTVRAHSGTESLRLRPLAVCAGPPRAGAVRAAEAAAASGTGSLPLSVAWAVAEAEAAASIGTGLLPPRLLAPGEHLALNFKLKGPLRL